MGNGRQTDNAALRVGALVGACFLLGSTGWLSWLYRITDLADPSQVDFFTMVVGYLAQAVGIGAFMLVAWRLSAKTQAHITIASLILYVVLLEPATMSASLAAALGFGWAMNVFTGISQGYYLTCLASCVAPDRRGVAFGCGYAASTLATWVLSSIVGGTLASGVPCLIVCVVLGAACIALVWATPVADAGANVDVDTQPDDSAKQRDIKPLIVLASATVVLISLVKSAGFSFPTADLSGVVDLELSRLFYGVGLVTAGIMADRDRRYALAFCAISLACPFFLLALTEAGASGVLLWVLGYLLFGFFQMFRVTLFADLASDEGLIWLAGLGLLLGRIGDALGTALCLALTAQPIALIVITAVLFGASMLLLFMLFQRLHAAANEAAAVKRAGDKLAEFCAAYGLSAREREVLPLLIKGRTNAEIAADLFVTESTVKYHMRNIRTKTCCKTRLEVIDLYTAYPMGK